MPELNKTYLYRMTHIANIPHIVAHGITHVQSPNANPDFMPIGDSSLIQSRNSYVLENGRLLGEYIPFYFAVRTPMLYVVQKGYNMVVPTPAQNIVYCVTSVQKIIDTALDFVFTDGHAVDRFTTQYGMQDIAHVDNLIDWKAVKATYWKNENDLDVKRRKEAEFLVLGDIPFASILGFVVNNQAACNQLRESGIAEEKIKIKPDFYF